MDAFELSAPSDRAGNDPGGCARGYRGSTFYLQADDDQVELYRKLGFREHPLGMVMGECRATEFIQPTTLIAQRLAVLPSGKD